MRLLNPFSFIILSNIHTYKNAIRKVKEVKERYVATQLLTTALSLPYFEWQEGVAGMTVYIRPNEERPVCELQTWLYSPLMPE